jgi:hypothetical protein
MTIHTNVKFWQLWNPKNVEVARHATKLIEQQTSSIGHHSQVQKDQTYIEVKDQINTLQTRLTSMYHPP